MRRLARQLREASLRAEGAEADDLNRILVLVTHGHLCPFEAQAILTDVIRTQHEREDQAA